MSRYIDADALKNQMQIHFNDNEDGEVRILENAYWHHKYVMELIANAPTIEIVRCKECMWWLDNLNEDNTDEDYIECPFDGTRRISNPDDFCSYGERREP